MRDVAALAGVALKTVSRVVNGVSTVDPELARRVRSAADKLGYRPNLAASNLRSGRSNIVGLLLEDVGNPFSAALHRSIEDYMRDRGMLLLTASLDEDPDRERVLASRLIDSRVDGLIIVPASPDHRYLVAEQGRGTSIVFVDREPRPLVADAVVADNRRSAARAVAHLASTGRRRIGYLGDTLSHPDGRRAISGIPGRLQRLGVSPPDGFAHHGLRTIEAAREATLNLLSETLRPTPCSPVRTWSPSAQFTPCTPPAGNTTLRSSVSTTSNSPRLSIPPLRSLRRTRWRSGEQLPNYFSPELPATVLPHVSSPSTAT